MSDKMREAFVQACKEYGPTISFSDFECGWDACMAWQAARTVPEGYVMVPVESTVEMNNAGNDARYGDMCDCGGSFASADEIYAAMLSAAPEGKK